MIDGSITAQEVVIRGRVAGTIRAARVILQHSARVDSEIYHTLLSIEEGAIFEGQAHPGADAVEEPVRREAASPAEAAAA